MNVLSVLGSYSFPLATCVPFFFACTYPVLGSRRWRLGSVVSGQRRSHVRAQPHGLPHLRQATRPRGGIQRGVTAQTGVHAGCFAGAEQLARAPRGRVWRRGVLPQREDGRGMLV